MGDSGGGKRNSKVKMHNVKPKRKNQDSAGGMGSFPPRDLFAHIAITYGTSFVHTHIIRQINLFLQNKANFKNDQMDVSLIITRDYEKKLHWTLGENKAKQSQSAIGLSACGGRTSFRRQKFTRLWRDR
jgi:hypothetical protein